MRSLVDMALDSTSKNGMLCSYYPLNKVGNRIVIWLWPVQVDRLCNHIGCSLIMVNQNAHKGRTPLDKMACGLVI